MKVTVLVLALIILAGCDRSPPPPPPVQPAAEDKSSVELKVDTENGAVEFKKEEKTE